MRWSRYNLLFESKRNGWLLYNSASNAFVQPEQKLVIKLKELRASPDEIDLSDQPDLYFKLRQGGFLVTEGQDDDFFNILKMRRLTANYAGNTMSLTIALTRACNFACPYCYEPNRTASKMSDDTEDNILRFVEKHKSVSRLSVVWYGGEPLLDFKRLKSMSAKMEGLGKKYSAGIITNGYCLNKDVIDALEELKITFMQITLDGKKETHNKRRYLINGGETFDKIVANIDELARSQWKGILNIRVNIDTNNCAEFAQVYHFIRERYPEKFGKQFTVYPGFVHGEGNPDTNCFFDSHDKGKFLAELAENHQINALSVFPHMVIGGCTMTRRNAYVVGPDGELYKCWNDVGIKEEEIGNVEKMTNWNMPLVAEGMVQASYLEDETCRTCFFFPICDGGCAKMRMLNKRDGQKRDTCSYFKNYMKELLEIHYEQKNNSTGSV